MLVIIAMVFVVAGVSVIQAVTVSSSITQTDDGSTATGFNYAGSATSSTVITGAGSAASVQLAIDYGTGADGDLVATTGACTGVGVSGTAPSCTIAGGTYNFSNVTVGASATLTVTGTTALIIKATGTVTIDGTVGADGTNASGGTGGAALAGGSAGGNTDAPGSGPGAGGDGWSSGRSGGAGGAGHGGLGGYGSYADSDGYCVANGAQGVTYNTMNVGGSGGGGGGNRTNSIAGTGGGGGGGGGGVSIVSAGQIIVGTTGIVTANGGAGTVASGGGAGAGGGSGGRIRLVSLDTVINNGILTANGGAGGNGLYVNDGGGGGGGRILIEDSDGILTGTGSTSVAGGVAGAGNCALNGAAGVYASSIISYFPSGTYTSGVLDTGQTSDFTTLGWTTTHPSAATSIVFDVRSGTLGASCTDATWNGWNTNVATVTTANATGSATIPSADGRCVQYRATLATASPEQTPSLDDITINYLVLANYNFSLSPSPASGEVVVGASSSMISTIMVTVQNPQDPSITDPVNFTATVSPSGPNISFSSLSCLPGAGICTVDLYASSASIGSYVITIKGTNASGTYPTGLAQFISVPLTVSPALDFSLSLSLGSGEVIRGYEATSYVDTILTVLYNSGANEIVSFTSNAPAGITFNASPTACAPSPGSCTSTVRLSAGSGVTAGDYSITITGTAASSGALRTTSFTLRVRDPLNYSVSASPNSGAVFQGNSTTSTITGSYIGGGAESVTFSNFTSATNPSAFSSVPAAGAISVSFSGVACMLGASQPSCAKTMTISNSSNTTVGNYVITVSGLSSVSGTVKTTSYTLNISGPFDFTMAYPSPPCATTSTCSGTVEQATSLDVAVNIDSISAAGENLSFSITGLPANTTYAVAPACTPSAGVPCTVTFTISPAINAPIGGYGINLVAESTKQIHSLPFTLSVTQGFTFNVTPSVSSGVAVRGESAESVIASITLLTGTGNLVALSVTGLETSGVNIGYPGGQACTPNCQQQITFTAPVSAVLGTYAVNIVGTAGTQTKQVAYTLMVVDPFDFSVNLSSTQGSVLQGGSIQTVATLGWVKGGSGTEVISLNASTLPAPTVGALTVDFSPNAVVGLGSLNPSDTSVVTMTASSDLTSNSYMVIMIATSGTTIKTKTYALTAGTTLDFTLILAPDNERVLQGASSAPVMITAQNTSAQDQPTANDILFSIGDTSSYRMPKDVTANPITVCSLGATIGSICTSSVMFTVGATAIDGTYLIPIVGTSGFVNRILYYTLKVGPLNLLTYQSPNFMTDTHQRPQVGFTWSPPAVFAGDTVQFDAASSTVYALGQPGLSASTPASAVNADFSWSFTGITGGSTLINPSVLYPAHGVSDISLIVTDKAGGCYTSTSSGADPCACTLSSSSGAFATVPSINVSFPRPSFRETKPQ